MKIFSPADEVLPCKRLENDFFLGGAIHCENVIGNSQIFAFDHHELKYLPGPYQKICSSRPQNFGGLKAKSKKKHGQMYSFVCPVNSSYKYVKKVKLRLNCNPNTFSELIVQQKNGGSEGIQTQIPD